MSNITDRFFNYFYNEQAKEYIESSKESITAKDSLGKEEATKDTSCLRTPLKYIFCLDANDNFRFTPTPIADKITEIITTGYNQYKASESDKKPGNLEYIGTYLSSDDVVEETERKLILNQDPDYYFTGNKKRESVTEETIRYYNNGEEIFVPESNIISNIRDACAFGVRTLALSVMLVVVGSFELLKAIPLAFIYIGFAGFKLLSTIFSCSPRKQEELTVDGFEKIGESSEDFEDRHRKLTTEEYEIMSTPAEDLEDEGSLSLFPSLFSSTGDEEKAMYESVQTDESTDKKGSCFSCFTNLNPFSSERQSKTAEALLELDESNFDLVNDDAEGMFGNSKVTSTNFPSVLKEKGMTEISSQEYAILSQDTAKPPVKKFNWSAFQASKK